MFNLCQRIDSGNLILWLIENQERIFQDRFKVDDTGHVTLITEFIDIPAGILFISSSDAGMKLTILSMSFSVCSFFVVVVRSCLKHNNIIVCD